jgi:hypothetical protein
MDMVTPALSGASGDHKDAIVKRAIIVVAGFNGVYIRLPSEKKDVDIYSFFGDRVGGDWLMAEHKPCLDLYYLGQEKKHDQFDKDVEAERVIMNDILNPPVGDLEKYQRMQEADTKRWNEESMGSPTRSVRQKTSSSSSADASSTAAVSSSTTGPVILDEAAALEAEFQAAMALSAIFEEDENDMQLGFAPIDAKEEMPELDLAGIEDEVIDIDIEEAEDEVVVAD